MWPNGLLKADGKELTEAYFLKIIQNKMHFTLQCFFLSFWQHWGLNQCQVSLLLGPLQSYDF
jgi:hypothetical protein